MATTLVRPCMHRATYGVRRPQDNMVPSPRHARPADRLRIEQVVPSIHACRGGRRMADALRLRAPSPASRKKDPGRTAPAGPREQEHDEQRLSQRM
nr:unnamed protein product [Digitaria exilis]